TLARVETVVGGLGHPARGIVGLHPPGIAVGGPRRLTLGVEVGLLDDVAAGVVPGRRGGVPAGAVEAVVGCRANLPLAVAGLHPPVIAVAHPRRVALGVEVGLLDDVAALVVGDANPGIAVLASQGLALLIDEGALNLVAAI